MSIAIALSLMLQSASGVNPACEKLMQDFMLNEDAYGAIYDADQQYAISERRFAQVAGDSSIISRRLQRQRETEERYVTSGDRLVNLMSGHGCPLPDHVTSPDTFRPQRSACKAAKGRPNENDVCDYIGAALKSAMQQRPAMKRR
ncbi:hypothetical protein [Sphingobium sp. IP1]|uniref:hypothetical protein n=1 Tax=Sphingobium sp. IP1 TaxID=2021637 RepID=UPI00117B8B49|nr:hypothetical protein [Sphingobium sp. IP1]